MDVDSQAIRRQFPFLRKKIRGIGTAYLDNAATTQKPLDVLERMQQFYEEQNANINRGMHPLAEQATIAYEQARTTVATFIGAKHPCEILFTRNATESINLVARSYGETLKKGDRIALSLLEQSLSLQDVLPVSSRVLILNEVGGSFGAYGTDEDIERLQGLKLSHGVRAARLRQCTSELWPIIERRHMRFDEVLALEPEEIEDRFGLSLFAASGAQVDLVRWLNESLDSLRAVGVVPPAAIASAATSRAAG